MRLTGETVCEFHLISLQLSGKIAHGVQAVLHENRSHFHMGLQPKLYLVLRINYMRFSGKIT